MPGESARVTLRHADRRVQAEAALLLFATPLLLFPGQWPLLTVAAALALPATWLAQAWLPPRAGWWPASPLNLPIALLALTAAMGVLVSADPDLSWPKAAGIFLGIAWVRLLTRVVHTHADLAIATSGFLLAGVGLALSGALSTHWMVKLPVLRSVIEKMPPLLLQLPGAPATGTHANQLAGTLIIFLPLLITLTLSPALFRRRRLARLLAGSAALLMLALLVLTQSRSAWSGLAAALALLLLLHAVQTTRRADRVAAGTLLGGGLIGAALLLRRISLASLLGISDTPLNVPQAGNLNTIFFRHEVWQWGVVTAHDFFLTGTGLGSFRRVVRRFYPVGISADYDIGHAHNLFLQVLLDLGILGLIAYLALIFVTLPLLWQATRVPRYRSLAYGLLGGQVALHAYGLTDALTLGSKPGILWWLLLALATVLSAVLYRPAPS